MAHQFRKADAVRRLDQYRVARGEPRQGTASKISRDPEIAERLWKVCEEATGVRWPFAKAAKAGRL